MDLAAQLVLEEEGPSSRTVYKDSRGLDTIARGCLVDAKVPGAGLCAEALVAQDQYSLELARLRASNLPGFKDLNEVRQAVMVSMCYQLGDLQDWPRLRAALSVEDYQTASKEMLDSLWHQQTPRRCERASMMMATGQWITR